MFDTEGRDVLAWMAGTSAAMTIPECESGHGRKVVSSFEASFADASRRGTRLSQFFGAMRSSGSRCRSISSRSDGNLRASPTFEIATHGATGLSCLMRKPHVILKTLCSVDWPMLFLTAWIVVTGAVLAGSLLSGLLDR